MEVFFCGKADRLLDGRGVTILEETGAEFDAREACFEGVELMAVVSASATRAAAAAAAALSSRRNTFLACFAALRFLMTELEKGDIVSGRSRMSKTENDENGSDHAVLLKVVEHAKQDENASDHAVWIWFKR